MPRKHKSDKHRSKGDRRNRNGANKALYRTLVGSGRPDHRIDLESLEFGHVFRVIGGKSAFACESDGETMPVVKAYDSDGSLMGKPVVDNLLVISDKHTALMQQADDAAARREARENHREEKKQKRVGALIAANERGSLVWFRQEVPDQAMRSVLSGSNKGKDPTYESDSLIICFKGDDSRYHVGAEKWNGDWSLPDSDGFRKRVGVEFDPLPHTYLTESEAHRSILMAIRSGAVPSEAHPVFEGNKDAKYMRRFAARLQAWVRGDTDMKVVFATPEPEKKVEGKGKWARKA